jgi:PhzF family phenazine biosynthesis protein
MKITQYQVDAFASEVFAGNPAAVCPLAGWLDDAVMQAIAGENNLSETAFFVPTERGFHLRWFSPVREVDLCGHATLATAHVLFEHLGYDRPAVAFETRSGELVVERRDGRLSMDFPATLPGPGFAPDALVAGLGEPPVEVLCADDYLVVFADEATIRRLAPDLARLSELDLRGVCVTAPGEEVDFVSRFFAPKYGIPEDPVTGSAHCALTPYWAARLGKEELEARQVSARGGALHCRLNGDRVVISGNAVTFLVGEISIPG